MNSEEAFDVWAPTSSVWSPWVKPILFASQREWEPQSDAALALLEEPPWLVEVTTQTGGYRDRGKPEASGSPSTAFVIDLPGAVSVAWGLLLARRGWRPVPLFNALPGPDVSLAHVIAPPAGLGGGFSELGPMPLDRSPLVDVWSVVRALRPATAALAGLTLATDRPPAFLLDAERRYGGPGSPGRFDNRSISLTTDFPSAVFLRSRGIERVVLIHGAGLDSAPQEDLAHTLLAWQQGGLAIAGWAQGSPGSPAPLEIVKPAWFRSMFQRFLATMGLRRSPLGGFGGAIPLPSSG